MALRKVEDQVKAETISLIETRLGEVLSSRCKHDTDSRELFLQGLLDIVIVGAAADPRAGYSDGFLEDLDGEEGEY